jgi:hypothetical protein
MSGGFLPEIAVDNRQIVLNDVLAWKFYKSYDVIGEKVSLWGEEFTIIGVVAEPSDRIARDAGVEQPRAYVYFTAMEELAPLTAPSADTQQNPGGSSSAPAASPASALLKRMLELELIYPMKGKGQGKYLFKYGS